MADGPRKRGKKREVQVYPFDDDEGMRWLFALVVGTALEGGACRVGLSRDGGALAIGMYLGDDYGTEYVRPDADLALEVRAIAQAWGVRCAVYDDTAGRWIIPA